MATLLPVGRLRVTIGWHHELVCRSVVFVMWKVVCVDSLQRSRRKKKRLGVQGVQGVQGVEGVLG